MKRFTLGSGLVGLCALMAAPLVVTGCSPNGTTVVGSGGSNGNGSGGSNGSSSGGSNGSSSGGSNGSSSGGSSGSGSGGSAGGSGMAGGCAMKPTGDLISDFSADGTPQVGMAYMGAQSGLTMPTVTTDGSLVITLDTGVPTMMYPYAFVGLGFKACFNASEYKGVTFKASGTLNTGCTIQFSTVDKEHNKVADGGTCTETACYASSKLFTLASSPTDVTVNFLDQTGGGADPSAEVVDPTQVTAIQWQVNPDATAGCKGTITIDDIKFVK